MTKFRVAALPQEVALAGEMCEPEAVRSSRALVLTSPGSVGVSVVPYDVVLRQITGSFLKVSAAPGETECRKS